MPHEAIIRYRKMLETRAMELTRSLRDRRRIAIEHSPEDVELMTLMTQRELDVAAMDRDSRLLKEVRAALDRIEDGEFGVCESCGQKIGARRLEAVPWTRRCVRCQELLDGSGPGRGARFGIAA
jgi:DnaK suppressor protein